MADDDLDRLKRDRGIGEPDTPLPDPWFIRDLRSRSANQEGTARTRPESAFPTMAPLDVREREAERPNADTPLPADRPGKPWYMSPFFFGGLAVAVVMLIALFASPRVDGPTGGAIVPPVEPTRVQPRLANSSISAASLQCAQPRTMGRLRDLFVGQAARGGNPARLRQLAAGLSLSVTGTSVDAGENTVESQCRGWVTMQVPLARGESDAMATPLVTPISYSVRLSAEGQDSVFAVQGGTPLIEQLARSAASEPAEYAEAAPLPAPFDVPRYEPVAPQPVQPRVVSAPRREPPAPMPTPQPEAVPVARYASPSFDCDRVTSRVNQMICTNPDLAALGRRMSRRFDQVAANLDPVGRDELEASRARFLQRKQSCGDEACIERVYEDRIDEIASYDDQPGDR